MKNEVYEIVVKYLQWEWLDYEHHVGDSCGHAHALIYININLAHSNLIIL